LTWVFFKFYLNEQFQNTVCCTYFNIQKHFDATIFDFQFELLYFGYSFGYISKKLGNFFQTSGHSGGVISLPLTLPVNIRPGKSY
jgi:hypothetical protein